MFKARLYHYNNLADYCLHSQPDENGENSELLGKLYDYRNRLDVEAVEETETGTMWEIRGYWYSDAQIERMLELKVFN